jgi:hypothetical protein
MKSMELTSTAHAVDSSSSATSQKTELIQSATAADSKFGTDSTNSIFLSEEERLIWVAAFFDAEGTVHLTKRGYLQVRLTNTEKKALEIAKQISGGKIHKCNGKNRYIYRLYLSGRHALKFLKKILPYTVVKRDAISRAIEFYENGRKDIDKYRQLINTTMRGDNGEEASG